MNDTTELREAVRDAIVTAPDMENLSSLADHVAAHLLGLGYPADPGDTIVVDNIDTDPETVLDEALARWGRTAVPGGTLHAAVIATEFIDAETRQHAVVVYNPDAEFSPLHAIGILTAAVSAVRS